jgi:hypothetical protein
MCPVSSIDAKQFENSYITFSLPDDWNCALEDAEWVSNGNFSMIAILTAKFVGPQDTPRSYFYHMEELGEQKGVVVERPARETLIGQVIWLDAVLSNTEVDGYQTRYLVRTEGTIGVLVTFSAHHSVVDSAREISDGIARSVEINSYMARPELQRH